MCGRLFQWLLTLAPSLLLQLWVFLADKIFNPLLESDGLLAKTAGSIIGAGEGRRIALMFIISGIMISIVALLIWKNKKNKRTEKC